MDTSCLETIVVGRVEPHIYAFSTDTIRNYLKVGDTYRPVSLRLQEWKKYFSEPQQQFAGSAKINDKVYFRDFEVHRYLEEKGKDRLKPNEISDGVYYSREFFKNATGDDVRNAIEDIKRDYGNSGKRKYKFYNAQDGLKEKDDYPRTETFDLRSNQQDTVDRFNEARANGRNNLLMYAVMRFGKSFTSMCCALAMDARLVVVVSAKADVENEWKRTVQSHIKFKDYIFVTKEYLADTDLHSKGKKFVVFLTLQDLQGDLVKEKHKELLQSDVDLLLVDETHFGARGEEYGKVLKGTKHKLDEDDFVDTKKAAESVKGFKAKITIHLSGTPYRILMGSEFQKEDIIAFYQFTDIVSEQQKWDEINRNKPEAEMQEDWKNPYYGFPEMIRFAFNPNKLSRQKLAELKQSGVNYAFSALLEPESIGKHKDGLHKKFKYEKEILELLQVIDGSGGKVDEELLGFLNYDKITKGQMCRHIVMVLPFCASCDAMEALIKANSAVLKKLNEYVIINISGVDAAQNYKSPKAIQNAIAQCEEEGKKTITLTVNRMLTGSTVPQWDTMLYLKDTASPQEYDQAIFRLQNQYIRTYKEGGKPNGDEIRYNMKPQTLLVDFMPDRMFRMQELKSQIYNVNTDASGNAHLQERLAKELAISPIIVLNKDKLIQVEANDILKAVSEYSKSRGVAEEVREIPVDLSLLEIEEVRQIIAKENKLGSKEGLSITANQGKGTNLNITDGNDPQPNKPENDSTLPAPANEKTEDIQDWTKRFQTFYSRILFFAFLTKSEVKSLGDIIKCRDEADNSRIIKNLGIDRQALVKIQKMNWAALRTLDYKIQNINTLSRDADTDPLKRCEVATAKFGKLGESEIVTPSHICDAMVALIPDDEWKNIVCSGSRVLDIASKSGEFPLAICRKLQSIGLNSEVFGKSILAIPTSSVAYEFTRRIYEELGLDVCCIAENFTSYDLLEVKNDSGQIDNAKISGILTQDRPFNSIKLDDAVKEGESNVKIEAIIGNPPYQVMANGDANGSDPIYHLFIDAGRRICDRGTLIHPGRFLFNAGKTPKDWNEKMLNDEHYKVERYWANASDVFPTVDLPGGIAVTYWNNNDTYTPIGSFVPYDCLRAILSKVTEQEANMLPTIMFPQTKYNLHNLYADYPHYKNVIGSGGTDKRLRPNAFDKLDVFVENTQPGMCGIQGLIKNKRVQRYIPRKYIEENPAIDKYNVLIPKANGSGAIGEISCTPLIGEPLISPPSFGYTGSFIGIGSFSTQLEASNCMKYIKSKFARAMLGTLKVTQDNPIETWANVPVQDFTSSGDIDWSESIPEIDRQLYKKYGLTPEEIAFIETNIKPME